MNSWLTLVLSLPTENATARMRAWRALKVSGAVVLRDGVYLLPDRAACRARLDAVALDVQSANGTAYLLHVAGDGNGDFPARFERGEQYAALLGDIVRARDALDTANAHDSLKQVRKLRKTFDHLASIDFFPDAAQEQTAVAVLELETEARRASSPDEPHSVAGEIPHLAASAYQGRLWATRRRPWVDRLASAWLIRRCIDPAARFLWLESPADCPPHAVGFDFDGAMFSHVGARVSFEMLLASFGLQQRALQRLGVLVHCLDAGGVQPVEAAGVERILAGLRDTIADDDQLLQAACSIFDGLLSAFAKEAQYS